MNFDYKLFTLINHFAGQNRIIDTFMVGLAKYGVLLYGLALLYLWFKPSSNKFNNRKLVLKAVISTFLALGINQVISFFYFRPRPFAHHQVNMLIDKSPDPSFPSDHATGSGALTFSILSQEPILGKILSVLTLLLIVSRIFVGTHYPLDVLGGLTTGLIGVMITNYFGKWLDGISNIVLKTYDKVMPF